MECKSESKVLRLASFWLTVEKLQFWERGIDLRASASVSHSRKLAQEKIKIEARESGVSRQEKIQIYMLMANKTFVGQTLKLKVT